MPASLPAWRVLEAVRDQAIFFVDLRGRIGSWSEGVGRILGWPRDEWIGRSFAIAFTDEDRDGGAPERELRLALESGSANDDRWMRRHDGSRFFALGTTTRIDGDDGRPLGYVKALRDITGAKTAEAEARGLAERQSVVLDRVQTALHERSAQLRAIADGVRGYAIFTLGTDGRVASWHDGAALMKGYSAEEAIGMPYAQLFTPEDRAAGVPERELTEAAARGHHKGESRRLRKDGSRFDAETVLTALHGPRGELLGFLKMTQDISERKRLEHERESMLRDAQAARAVAEQASRAKDEFLATISHELRTPLSAILGWAAVLERGGLDAETMQHGLAAILRNARSQVRLIEDLLDMNRIESGQLRLERQPVELGGIVAAAVDSALPAAAAKGVALRWEAAGGDGGGAAAVVAGDPARLQQVVGNLLSNAVKFTPAGGRVTVTLDAAPGQARLVVADTGQGIDPGFLGRVFQRFQQQDGSTTRRHGGLGIGLATARHLVHLHGGTLTAASEGPGRGASFTVTLPRLAAAAAAAPAAADAAPEPQRRLDGVTVLIVDDEADVRAVAARALTDAGATVHAAAGSDEALALLARVHPAVLLSDIGMPGSDGYDLIRRVRALPADAGGTLPAAAFTAYTRDVDRCRAAEAGYQLHLAKPVAPQALVDAVARLAGLAN